MQDRIHIEKYGKTERRSFNKIKDAMAIPNFIEVQINSYQRFLETGIKEVFQDYSPIKDNGGRVQLEFADYRLDGQPKYSVKECKDRDATYAVPLKVKIRLVPIGNNDELSEVMESEVYMGDIPLMTDNGSFIINGAERVIVSQLMRSPGVYCASTLDRNGVECFKTTIMPERGAWLEFVQDGTNNLSSVHVDRTRKISTTIFLKAMGVGDEDSLKELFGNHPMIVESLNKDTAKSVDEAKVEMFRRLKTGEIPSIDAVTNHINNMFYERRKYDFSRVGRYKANQKLCLATRLTGNTVAEDVVDVLTGEVLAEKGTVISEQLAVEIQNCGINRVALQAGENVFMCIGNNTVDIKAYLGEEYADCDFFKMGILEKYVYFPTLYKLYCERENKEQFIQSLIDNAAKLYVRHLTIDDVVSAVSYNLGMQYGFGTTDFIDHLANRRVRSVGELLQTAFSKGMSRLEKYAKEKMQIMDFADTKPEKLINIRPLSTLMREFFGSSQLSQFMDQPNPIAELTHKRKLSALGPGGLSRERAGVDVRDVHHSHYGRMCPIETPEGQNIGLITSLSTYARVNEYGFIESPYRLVDKKTGKVTNEVHYLPADEEDKYIVAQANEPLDEKGRFVNERVICRDQDDIREFPREKVDFMDVSPKQLISVATSLIPFLENDDINRALMGSNMQRQAVPLLRPEAPIIGTGIEYRVAYDSGVMSVAKNDGVVTYVSGQRIVVKTKKGDEVYELQKFERSNQGTCINQKPIVRNGQAVKKGDILADGPSTQNGELSLGRNILVGFMTWEGYNYEDAILISEELVKDDVFTSIHIEEYSIDARDTKLGMEEITRDIPNISEDSLKDLDENGIVRVGATVRAGDILVGKTTPKGETEPSPDEKLLKAIFGEKSKEVRDTSLKVPHGVSGIVVDIKVFTRENKDELAPGVKKMVIVSVAQKRKISVGDKMAGRHGNKGVISRVLPREDMPFLADGTPLQIVLNPLGVPSRMNIGQVLEVHLGLVAKLLDWKVATPVFDGATEHDIKQLFIENGLPENGKIQLYDGRTGEPFENKVTVGYMYMLKLVHLVDDKIHARSTGPYSLVTQQPLGGKAQFGGQRFGEMEVWALEAYGAAHVLQEIITIKSDDVEGRNKACANIVKGNNVGESGIPESFKVLIKELQALGLDVKVLSEDNKDLGSITDLIEEESSYDNSYAAPRKSEELGAEIDLTKDGEYFGESDTDDVVIDLFSEDNDGDYYVNNDDDNKFTEDLIDDDFGDDEDK